MRIDDGRVLPTFLNQALNNKPYTIFGDGNQTRSFCYIDDTINGLYKLINSNINKPVNIKKWNFNYGVDQKINSILKIDNNIEFKSIFENDPKMRKTRYIKSKKQLKWFPKISLQDGIKLTLSYYEKTNWYWFN